MMERPFIQARQGSPALCLAASSCRTTVLSVIGVCLLTALLAQVRIALPGTHVPMTLQSLGMLIAGYALAPVAALSAMLLYVVCGTAYPPFLAPGSAGVPGPTGGYLLGFVVGAWLIARLRGGSSGSVPRLLAAGAAGTVVLFAFGVAWNAVWLGGDLTASVSTGLLPFAPKAVVQLALVVTGVRCVRAVGGWVRSSASGARSPGRRGKTATDVVSMTDDLTKDRMG
jgi:biotin transport system substrate-specific component